MAEAVLDRVADPAAVYSPQELALIEPIASAVAPVRVVDSKAITQSIGSLAASMPAQASNLIAGRLKLRTYETMLAGCDERALAYACRRCLDELDWFPTVRQLKERIAGYVSPEQHAINRARYIIRTGRRQTVDDWDGKPPSAAELAAMARTEVGRAVLDMGLSAGWITAEQHAAAVAPGPDEPRLDGDAEA